MEVRNAESKRAVLAELLEQGMVLVTLDARQQGVDVPPHLRDDAQLRLNLSYRFGLPMAIDDAGVDATLTFSGSPYPCRLPWRALYLFVSHVTGRPILFPTDVPSEIAVGGNPAAAATPSPVAGVSHAQGRPRLRLLPRADEEQEPKQAQMAQAAPAPLREQEQVQPEPAQDSPRSPPRRGHLRVVK